MKMFKKLQPVKGLLRNRLSTRLCLFQNCLQDNSNRFKKTTIDEDQKAIHQIRFTENLN